MSRVLILVAAIVSWSANAYASDSEGFHSRSFRAGVSYNLLTADPFSGVSAGGAGFAGIYEFNISPVFTLGIDLQYRHFAGDSSIGQMGYGLMMKHYLSSPTSESGYFRPYLEYGLLMNVVRQQGVEGSGTAHDTRLAVGADFEVGGHPLFADASYHYSRLSYFDVAKSNLDYLQVLVGYRFGWR